MRTLVNARSGVITLILALAVALTPLVGGTTEARSGPVADSDEAYLLCGRVFPDPQAYWVPTLGEATPHPGTGTSPWAKGNAECAARTFMTYDETVRGLYYLADENEITKDFVDVLDLSATEDPKIKAALDEEFGDGWSEGIPNELGEREEQPLYIIKVTAPEGEVLVDGVAPVAEADREAFVWGLSMHGIERAGVEGGVRAIEDLATWGSLEPNRPILETSGATIDKLDGETARNMPVGEVLMKSVSYFTLLNPDGWRRGDPDQGNAAFLRYNGNGMDLNRDWPTIGYTDPSYTPHSERESRTFGNVLKALSDNWAGGIDLHGMVAANAFSYTLIGGSQREFGKNERVMQFVEQAWADAEERLSWSPQIKPNDAPEQCVKFTGVTPNGETNMPPNCDQRAYGVQYGTIWDTIDYTVTGDFGAWIDSPLGLNADGIDNEMMLSHLGTCGTGTCYIPEAEQLHVDGNKSLIYAMLNFSLQPPEAEFEVGGDVAYLVNERRLVDPGVQAPTAPAGAVAPANLSGSTTHNGTSTVLATFTVDNAGGQTYVGGISGSVRWPNVASESAGDANAATIEYLNPDTGAWVKRPIYTSLGYRTPGQHSDWNYPKDGTYRFVVSGLVRGPVTWEIEFSTEPVWTQPLQEPFDVSNVDFFSDLAPYVGPNTTLTPVTVDEILDGTKDLSNFDSVIAIDGALLPGKTGGTSLGLAELPPTSFTDADKDRIGAKLRAFAESGGNVVLTDDAIEGLAWMGVVPASGIGKGGVYANNATFTNGFGHPLATDVQRPGTATGLRNRKQMAEPVPLGYNLNNSMPQWYVTTAAVTGAGGTVVATDSGNTGRASIAQIPVGQGQVRTFGGVLPFPTSAYYHPLGLFSYSVTDNGYIVLDNLLTHENPAQVANPDLTPSAVDWVASGIPTRIYIDGSKLDENGQPVAVASRAATVRLTAAQRELLIR